VKHTKTQPIPASIEEAAQHPQAPHPDQTIPLHTHRVVSSIPRADELRPATKEGGTQACQSTAAPHQPEHSHWVYPSEQQFYNAMRRKGHTADPGTMSTVVQIHNAVNERTWAQVCQWEKDLHGVDTPRLIRFLGRPQDTSPKAWINANVLGRKAPFDRHDWFVDRGDGKEHRYVIDFYEGNPKTTKNAAPEMNGVQQQAVVSPVSMYLDVRPALDDPQAALDRIRMTAREMLPGIFDSSPRTHTTFPMQQTANPAKQTDNSANGK